MTVRYRTIFRVSLFRLEHHLPCAVLHADAVQVHLHKLDAINHALAAMQWHITDEYVMLSGAQTLRSLVYNNGTNCCTGG